MTDVKRGFGVFLTFNGQCKQALKYYRKCFGGILTMQTLADEPNGWIMDKRMQQIVVSATLTNSYFNLTATDLSGDGGVIIGNNVSILVECATVSERTRFSDFLGETKNAYPFNDDKLVSVVDRYNINWILSIR